MPRSVYILGIFMLPMLFSSSAFSETMSFQAPNDSCHNAYDLFIGQPVVDSTTNSTSDVAPLCGTSNDIGGGVWYKLTGNGSALRLSLCSGITDYDTKLRVYTGDCQDLICVAGTDDSDCQVDDLYSQVLFDTEILETYYILVHGYGSAEGEFQLLAEEVSSRVNDFCPTAIELTCGEMVIDSINGALEDYVPYCCFSINGGLWYSFQGTGGMVTLSTCDDTTNFTPTLFVYSGDCSSLECVGATQSSGDCGNLAASQITLATESGTTYYVLIDGATEAEQINWYALSLTCGMPANSKSFTVTTNMDTGIGTLRNILEDSINNGDTVFLNLPSGSQTITLAVDSGDIDIANDVVIVGQDDTLDAQFLSRVFDISDASVEIHHLHLRNGFEDGNGGLIRTESATGSDLCFNQNQEKLSIYNSTFHLGNACIYGGAIYSGSVDVEVYNSNFTDCEVGLSGTCGMGDNGGFADGSGGAIALIDAGLTIDEALFSDCLAARDGGAIYTTVDNIDEFTIATIKNTVFAGDSTKYGNGGALWSEDISLQMDSCLFASCRAGLLQVNASLPNTTQRGIIPTGGSGGAIFFASGTFQIRNSEFINNGATNSGGAIAHSLVFVDGGPDGQNLVPTIDHCIFERDSVDIGAGGAIAGFVSVIDVIKSNFYQCQAGDIQFANAATAPDRGIIFIQNEQGQGGAIYHLGFIRIDSSVFEDNVALRGGGGLSLFSDFEDDNGFGNNRNQSDLITFSNVVTNSYFLNDTSYLGSGGGIRVIGGLLEIDSSEFEGCRAGIFDPFIDLARGGELETYNGGAVAGEGACLISNYCTYNNNVAVNYGGAIFNDGGNPIDSIFLKLDHCNFTGDTTILAAGGGVFTAFSKTTINDTKFYACQAGTEQFLDLDTRGNGGFNFFVPLGGAMFNYFSELNIEYSSFDNNGAVESGGALGITYFNLFENDFRGILQLTKPLAYISNTSFTNDTSYFSDGGAIFSPGVGLILSQDTFDSNAAPFSIGCFSPKGGLGGAIYLERRDSINASECIFTNNYADVAGGAIYNANNFNADEWYTCDLGQRNRAEENRDIGGPDTIAYTALYDQSIFSNNKSGGPGGAIFMNQGGSDITNTIFESNTGGGFGGALFMERACLRTEDCQFITNEVDSFQYDPFGQRSSNNRGPGFFSQLSYGGAIAAYGLNIESFINQYDSSGLAPVLVRNTLFESNNAAYGGGAILFGDPRFNPYGPRADAPESRSVSNIFTGYRIENSDFLTNEIDAEVDQPILPVENQRGPFPSLGFTGGGALMNANQPVFIEGSLFDGNTSTFEGGAIANVSSSLFGVDEGLENSSANNRFISGNSKEMIIERSQISNNTAAVGGGIYNNSNFFLKCDSTRIIGNQAATGGGLMAGLPLITLTPMSPTRNAVLSDVIISKSLVRNNMTVQSQFFDGSGGGLNFSFVGFSIDSSVVDSNYAVVNGGGIQARGPINGHISSSSISNNIAHSDGAGVYALSTGPSLSLTANNSTFAFNEAHRNGGGLFLENADVNILLSTISNNQAESGGGIYYDGFAGRPNMNIVNTTIADNQAIPSENLARGEGPIMMTGGGGILITNGGTTSLRSSIVAQNTTSGMGEDIFNNMIPNPAIIVSDTFNIVGDTCKSTFMGIENLDFVGGCQDNTLDPGIAPLADNGGFTQTHALLCGSIAFNNGGEPGDTIDQRGLTIFDILLDIGSFEAQDDAIDFDGDGFCRIDGDCVELEDELPPGAADDQLRPEDFNPGAEELCDGYDNNCDGQIDNDPQCNAYCEVSGTDETRYIRRVQIRYPYGTPLIDNVTGPELPDGYGDYTDQQALILQSTAPVFYINISPGGVPDIRYYTVFVDWNNDDDFEDVGEQTIIQRGSFPVLATIVIPPSRRGIACSYTVRVVMSVVGYQGPCGEVPLGEVEDYTLCIKECIDCGGAENDPFIIGSGNPRTNIELPVAERIKIQPNPVTDDLILTFNAAYDQEAELRIISGQGLNKQRQPAYFYEGENQVRVPLQDMAPGLYYIVIESSEGTTIKPFNKL